MLGWLGFGMQLAIGVLMGWMALRIRQGRFHRNPVSGIRTVSTMASEQAWQAAHRVAEPWYRWCSVLAGVFALGSGAAGLLGFSDDEVLPYYIGTFLVIAVLVIAPTPAAIRAAKDAGGRRPDAGYFGGSDRT